MSIKLSNVLGVPFRPFVRDQLKARVRHGITGGQITDGADILRSADDVSYLGNQLAWVKLASSVTVSTEYLTLLKEQFAEYGDGDAFLDSWTSRGLAQNWILQAGTSKQSIDAAGNIKSGVELRAGIGDDGAYGLGGSRTQGYRPMPGITSVQIKSAGRLGSLRYATIDFKVWNRNQLDVMDALYLRLGYTMLLEWGHVQYFEKESSQTLTTATSGIDIFFNKEITKEELQYEINKKIGESRGNYDAMLGVVCNFDCSFNQEGGWDCSVKLIGLGSIMESQKINLSYTMPPSIQRLWEKRKKQIREDRLAELQQEQAKLDQEAKDKARKDKDAEIAAYDKANPIKNLPTFATNNYPGDTEGKQINELADIARPLLDFSKENNIKENATDSNESFDIVMQSSVANINTKAAAYFSDNVLYLAHLEEVGFINPLTKGKSTITIATSTLNEVSKKLATENAVDYEVPSAINGGIIGGIVAPLFNVGGDKLLLKNSNTPFADLTILELYKRVKTRILIAVGSSGVTLGNLIGFGEKGFLNIFGFDPDFTKGMAFKKGVVIKTKTPAAEQTNTYAELKQYLSVALSQVTTLQGKALSSDLQFATDDDFFRFLQDLNSEIANYTGRYQMKVTNVEDEQFSDGTTTYTAVDETAFELKPTKSYSFINNNNNKTESYSEIRVVIQIQSSIPNLIENIVNKDVTQKPGPLQLPTGSAAGTSEVDISADNMSLGLGSALEAMLNIVKYDAIAQYGNNPTGKVEYYPITSITAKFLTDGTGSLPPMAPLFNGDKLNVRTGDPKKIDYYPFLDDLKKALKSDSSLVLKDPTSLGVKGYCTALMQDYNLDPDPKKRRPELERWEEIPSVNFEQLFKSYLIPKYILNSAQDAPKFKNEYPVYISLGYLLFFLNNQSLLYDTTKKSAATGARSNNIARPIFYLDYNPQTNLCGTLPSQLSIDPEICMIPFSRSTDAYKKLFIFGIEPDEILFTTGDATDRVSSAIQGYKTKDNAYQALTMNVLLNVDYLLNLIKSSIDRDKHNNVYLQPFLEQILADVNRSMGDVNAFRVAYNDNANTVVINDDQYVPPLDGEECIFEIGKQLTGNKKNLFELPVFENISLARSFTLQTDTSTRMSRAIAIGAQVQNSGAAQSVDASSYHWLNNGFTDRIIEVKQNATTPKKVIDPKDKKEDPNLILATKFNTHIKNIYSKGGSIYREGTDPARNFLIQSATKVKAEDEQAYASLTIPYNATLSLMGISGIMMGNAFLLPDKILPISIRGTKSKIKYGFYVMGLEHSLASNMWVTDIKGQIVRIRADRSPSAAFAQSSDTFIGGTTAASPQPASGIGTNFVASTTGVAATARAAVVAYYGGSITDQEWNEYVALIFAEAGNTREQRAYIAAIILNRARQEGRSISDSIRIENAYQPVTGIPGRRGSEQSFINGPTNAPERESDIYQTLSTSLANIPKGYNAFTALNPAAYTTTGGLAYRQKLLNLRSVGKAVVLYNNNNRASINGTIAAQL